MENKLRELIFAFGQGTFIERTPGEIITRLGVSDEGRLRIINTHGKWGLDIAGDYHPNEPSLDLEDWAWVMHGPPNKERSVVLYLRELNRDTRQFHCYIAAGFQAWSMQDAQTMGLFDKTEQRSPNGLFRIQSKG